MAKKDIPYLKVVKPPDNPKEVRKEEKRRKGKLRRAKFRRALVPVILAALAVCGTWLLLNNQTYGRARTASSFQQDLSDTNSYVQFADGIVRYNRDGVVYLNRKNEEQWIQPTQIQNPIIVTKEHAFAVADNGGNSIFVFSEGKTPDYVQKWEVGEPETDLLLCATHSDDDQLFFAGLIPYYAGHMGLRVRVAYFVNHYDTYNRTHELLDGLWHCGLKYYPDISPFPDGGERRLFRGE